MIDSYVPTLDDVVDVACGDLSFWEGRDCQKYFGLDISPTIINHNRLKRPSWNFRVGNAERLFPDVSGRVVFCFDLLFHVMDNEVFEAILKNIAQYSKEWIFIFTWRKNPFNVLWRLNRLKTELAIAFRKNKNNPFNLLRAKSAPMSLLRKIRLLFSRTDSDALYQKYRRFEDYTCIIEGNGFVLVGKHGTPHERGIGAMYVFRRRVSSSKGHEAEVPPPD